MENQKPKCGHSSLKPNCRECERFKTEWYAKIQAVDEDWHDIEYGLENPERIYQPVDASTIDPITTDYYDRVLEVSRLWEKQGRRKRDCIVAELFGNQFKDTGTYRGISKVLKSMKLRPNSFGSVQRTINEINTIVSEKIHRHLDVEQRIPALYLLDSKPKKDEADGEKESAAPDHPTELTRSAA